MRRLPRHLLAELRLGRPGSCHLGHRGRVPHATQNLAELRLAQGRVDEARTLLDAALSDHAALRLYDSLSYGLETAARVAWSDNRADEAARLLGAADRLRGESGVPIWGARLTRFEGFAGLVRDALGDEAFAACWTEGRALGVDGALEAAFSVVRRAESDGQRL
jgi:hypothetical protein